MDIHAVTPSSALAVKNTALHPCGSARLNGKKLKVVVVAQQYPGSRQNRGFGDLASGVRELRHLQKLLPNADFFFVFEHYATGEQELLTLKKIAECTGVKNYILFGLKNDPQLTLNPEQLHWEHQDVEVINLLDSADLIIHAPCGYIDPVIKSFGKYAPKSLGFYEYDCKTGKFRYEESSGIKTLQMGFLHNRLYLSGVDCNNTGFNDPVLADYCLNPNAVRSTATNQQPFYFAYGHTVAHLAQMLRLIVLAEGDNERDMVLVTSLKFDQKIINKCSASVVKKVCPYRSIRLHRVSNDDIPQEQVIFSNPEGQSDKRITLITPKSLNDSDFCLLQKESIFNYSSGDVSTSDVLALGKIPLIDPYKKRIIFLVFLDKLEEFCQIPGNQQYQPFIGVWHDATASFIHEAEKRFQEDYTAEQLAALQQLTSPQWQNFEQKFTDWLKQNNETEALISAEIAAVLHSSEP